jgi:phosphomannomutase
MTFTPRFGTDGWRGVLSQDFTTSSFVQVASAILYTPFGREALAKRKKIYIGYDTRFLAPSYARLLAHLIVERGGVPVLSSSFVTTPGLCCALLEGEGAFGCMITASHNPPEYLGFKVKGPYGGSATNQMVSEIEEVLRNTPPPVRPPFFPESLSGVTYDDFEEVHISRIRSFFSIRKKRDIIVHDAMYGAGQGIFRRLMEPYQTSVVGIRWERNPGFSGVGPEPLPSRLGELFRITRRKKALFGFATDGDGDRIAVCDERGNFVSPQWVFALNLLYLTEEMGLTGRVIRTVSTTDLVEKISSDKGCATKVVPVGFKHIVPELLRGDVLIAGEESGGIAIVPYLKERDGIVNALLLRELIYARKKPLSELLKRVFKKYGEHHFTREDIPLSSKEDKERIQEILQNQPPQEIGKEKVLSVDTTDGWKFLLSRGWLLLRFSGTEPLLRVYTEGDSFPLLKERLNWIETYLKTVLREEQFRPIQNISRS